MEDMEETQSSFRDVGIAVQTEIRGSVFIFNWAIQNISKLSDDEVIKSPPFHLDQAHEFYAQFQINSAGGNFYFHLISGADIKIEHDVSIINNSGKVLLNKITTANYSSKKSPDLLPNCTDAMEEAEKENTLTFKCVCKFDKFSSHTFHTNPTQSPLDDLSALSKDLKSLFETPLHPDVTLQAGDCALPAHKAILSARSSVFARMFQTPMEETKKNTVDIPDLDPNTVRALVSYLYSAVLPCDDFETAYSLYYAGDKYNVPSLCAACRSVLLGKMAVGNACRVLSLADQHSDAELKREAMRFVNAHFEEVLQTESWAELMKGSSGLAAEVAVFCSGRSKTDKNEKVQE